MKRVLSILLAAVVIFSSFSILAYAKTEMYSNWSNWSTNPVTADNNTEVETKTVSEYWRTRYDYDYYCTWHEGDSYSNPYLYSNTGGKFHFSEGTGYYETVYSYTRGVQTYPLGYYRDVEPGYVLSADRGELPGNTAWMKYCKNDGNKVGHVLRADQSGQVDGRNQIFFLVNSSDEYHNVTYYRYRKNISTYSVSYNANGGTGAPAEQTKTHGKNLVISSVIPQREDYSFLGWATTSSAQTPTYSAGGTYSENQDVILYAVWEKTKFNITYNANGGTGAPEPQKKNKGVDLTIPSVIPEREDYTFLGWATTSTAQTPTYSAGGTYTEDKDRTLYAVWEKTRFSITYDANGGTGAPELQKKNKGEDMALSTAVPQREGYTFLGWAEKNAFINGDSVIADFNNAMVQVYYDPFTGTVYPTSGPSYPNMNLNSYPVDPSMQRSHIEPAYKSSIRNTAAQVAYQPGDIYTADKDVDLYAVWSGDYTITYDANGGEGAPSPQTYSGNGALAISSQIPRKSGYIFKGWAYSSDATEAAYQPGDAYTNQNDATLYAVWEAKTGPYTITYEANGGVGAPAPQYKNAGETITLSSVIPVRLGYKFAGWSPYVVVNLQVYVYHTSGLAFNMFTQNIYNQYSPSSSYSNDCDVTLYAVWEKDDWVANYTVETYIMDTRGEYELSSVNEYEADFEVVSADFIVPPGFTLNTEKSILTQQLAYNYAPVLKVYLDRNIHTVSFDDGTQTVSNDLYYGANIVAPQNPEKEGYTFLGWSEDGETVVDIEQTVPDRDLNYMAVWSRNQYTITYKLDSEEYVGQSYLSAEDTILFGDTVTVREKPEITCRIVTDWEFTPALIDGKMPAQNVVANAYTTFDHTPGDAVVENRIEPTCIEEGSYDTVVYCSVCGEEISRETTSLPIIAHDYEEVVIAPTCTEEGYSIFTCSYCGLAYEDLTVEALGHDWGEWTNTTAPTCISVGEDTRVCKRDSSHIETREAPIDPDNHTNVDGEWTVVVPATCTGDGTKVKYCQDCHEIAQTETIAIDPNNHDYQFTETVSPTCTQQGYDVYTCSRCNVSENRNYTDALGHNYESVVTAPTCTQEGYTTYTCSKCGDTYTDEAVDALGHDWGEWTNTVAPTCISVGEDTRVCERDSSHTETREVPIDPKNHTNVDGVWTVVTPATCTSDGTKVKYCQDCHEIAQTETIALNSDNHNYQFTETVSPTCTQQGYDIYTCSRCNVTENKNYTDALGHNYEPVVTAPTCTQAGYTTYTCSRCGDNYTDAPVAALGHDWGEWVTVTEATFDDDGLEERVCKRDPSHKETRVIPKPTSFTATFVVNNDDGSLTTVDTVRFVRGQVAIKEPDVPSKGDNYIGYWEPYSLSGGDIVIHAKYDLKTSDTEKPLETGKDVIYENGTVKVTMSAFAESVNAKVNFGAQPVDVLLVLDHSYSMISNKMNNNSMTRYDALKQSAKAFVEGICDSAQENNVDHRISVISFNSSVFYLTGNNANNTYYSALNNRQSLINAVSGSRKSGSGTRTDLGISEAKNILNTSADLSRKQIVVVFTDGEPTSGQSSFDITVANNALAAARDIKNDIGASIYCVGVTENADPEANVVTNSSNRKDQLNALLHAVSSNYENGNTVSMTNIGNRTSDGYYVATEDAEELTRLFKNIVAQQISNTITFRNLTLVDTISEYFTLTVEQENALRDYLEENYAVESENVIITRNDDGTTTIRIEDVTPRAVYSNEVQTGYGVTVTYEVSANENAIEAGFYSVSTDENSYIEKDEQKVAEFNLPDDIEIEQARYIVKYILDGEVYCVEETQAGAVISPPQLENAVFVVGNNSVVTDRVTEISGSIVSFEPVFVEDSGKFIDFDLNNMLIKNIPQGTKDLDSLLNLDGYTVEMDNGIIATGSLVTLKNAAGVEVASFTAVVGGDVTGDGYIDAFDLALVGEYINSFTEPEGEAYMKAVDMVEDGYLDATDMAYLIYTANFEI